MTEKQKKIVEEIKKAYKALPFEERMMTCADGTIGVVDEYLEAHPEKQKAVDELLDLDDDAESQLEDDYAANHDVHDEDELDELRDANEDIWINKVCAAELNLYAAYMNDEEDEITEEECEAAGATLEDYKKLLADWQAESED